jgi:DNA-binding CsgD family transcriptional regulator
MESEIIGLLKLGYNQPEISAALNCSLSSVEKYLKVVRKKFSAKTMFHLGFIIGNEKG